MLGPTSYLRAILSALAGSLLGLALLVPFAQAQVLTQVNKDLGNGFHSQESKQINVPGRWHSNQSFKFLYFEKRHLCQCSEFSISPTGQIALFQDTGTKVISSFKVAKNSITPYPKLPAGKLKSVTWLAKEKQVTLELLTQKDGTETTIKKRLTLK
ncbi:hypothetical protein [Undibacterium sp. Di24W]|uniref:hypothetical protein n=1 Tax=Undibacterium sp. Di24W TaxID=3413033 RepID=UPI003BF42BBD